MARSIFVIVSFLTLISCEFRNTKGSHNLQSSAAASGFKDSTSVQMIDSVYNFGKIAEGDKVEYNFRFRNMGKNPLIIASAVPGCGCTIADKPDAPVSPGQIGIIKVVFNSKGKMGDITKEVTVTSNAYPSFPQLLIKGEVTKEHE